MLLVTRDGRVLQVPFSYRPEPLPGADDALVATMEHSVLGQRWVYDASRDPVAVECFHRALAGEQEEAAFEIYEGEECVGRREPVVRVSRRPGIGPASGLRMAQVVGDELAGAEELVAVWPGGQAVVIAR